MNTHLISTPSHDRQHLAALAPRRRQRGVTLIELMTVLTIAGILLSVAVPSMAALMDSVKLSSTTNMFLSSLRLARSESMKRGGRVALCKSADGATCSSTGGWEQGWVTFHDINGNGEIDAGETVIERVDPLSSTIRFTGNQNVARYIGFTAGGGARTTTGGFLAGTLTLCHVGASAADGRQIMISSGGRPRVQQTAGGQCV